MKSTILELRRICNRQTTLILNASAVSVNEKPILMVNLVYLYLKNHLFSVYAKFSEKIIFLTACYAHVRIRVLLLYWFAFFNKLQFIFYFNKLHLHFRWMGMKIFNNMVFQDCGKNMVGKRCFQH